MSVVGVCCALDVVLLLVGVAAASGLRPRAVRAELLGLMGFALACVVVFAVPTRALGGSFAALRGVAHAVFCVALPVVAVRAARVARARRWLAAALLGAFAIGEGCYVWALEVEPFRLEVTRHDVVSPRLRPVARALGRPLRVACLADLQAEHIGPHEVRAFDELVAFGPDVVLLLGDYLHVSPERAADELRALREQIARIDAQHGIYAVDGDVDGVLGGVAHVFAGTAVRPLVDARAQLPGLPVDVIGLSRARSRVPFVDVSTARRLGGERYPIVIGHAPDFMNSVVRDGFDPDALMVAGHTHGGQVQVPGFGPPITLSSVPRWLAGGGVFRRGRAWLVCSRGIGLEREDAPRIRFWCRPQLVLLELKGGGGE